MSSKPHPRVSAKVIHLKLEKEKKAPVPDAIAIPSSGRIDVIRVEDILYLRSENNYTHIHIANGEHFIASTTLGLFENRLSGAGFLRVHNQYLVNKAFISSYVHTKNRLKLGEEHVVPVSRNKKQMLMDYLRAMVIQA